MTHLREVKSHRGTRSTQTYYEERFISKIGERVVKEDFLFGGVLGGKGVGGTSCHFLVLRGRRAFGKWGMTGGV